jgi:malonate-semialdehyde dehydrogenase (acetylating)/methylmalonate-semialdehyde dehydrogenase
VVRSDPIAITADNTVVLKAATRRCRRAAAFIAGLRCDPGLPNRAFAVRTGERIGVYPLLRYPGIAAVSFVGSTPAAPPRTRQ